MKKSFYLLVLIVLLINISGCKSTNSKLDTVINDNLNPYNFTRYENNDISDIEIISKDKCLTYKFKYLSDGYKIDGYISIPIGCVENKTPGRVVLYNRGGNSRIGLLEDDDTEKLCLETSRIVVASQYRGAGESEGTDQFGGDDLNDVIKLIDLCESFEFVDMNDFCSIGVSRGGMMTFMAARADERIKKIVAVSSVSNLTKAYSEREDMKKVLNNYIGGSPEQLPSEYEKRSVSLWADEIKIPVLLIHSRYDESVAFSQSEDLYKIFTENNVNCDFVIRDDDVHGFTENDKEVILNFLE